MAHDSPKDTMTHRFAFPRFVAIAFACLCAAPPVAAQTADLARSEISFGFKQENVPGSGKFRKFTAQVTFDAAKPEATKAAIEVDVSSADLGDADWNRDMQSATWFNAKQFPKSTLNVAGAKALGGGRFEAPGKFTLKGITRDVVATFTAKSEAGGTLLEGSVPLKRNDFKVGDGIWSDIKVVADEVPVRFKLYLKK